VSYTHASLRSLIKVVIYLTYVVHTAGGGGGMSVSRYTRTWLMKLALLSVCTEAAVTADSTLLAVLTVLRTEPPLPPANLTPLVTLFCVDSCVFTRTHTHTHTHTTLHRRNTSVNFQGHECLESEAPGSHQLAKWLYSCTPDMSQKNLSPV